jgi:PTS system fructose-specific IIC component
MQSLKPVLIFPLLGTIFIALFMIPIHLVVTPVSTAFQTFITHMSIPGALIIGCIAGAMMAYDMGGPVNKIAYVFGVASISAGTSSILMASIMAAGMTPPLGIALATTLCKKKFTDEQRQAGKANWMMGISFMTEGALPFASSRPKVYIPILMAGSILAAALVALFQTSVPAPHGGLFVIFIMENWWGFLIALGAGTLWTACLLFIFLRALNKEKTQAEN